MLGEARTLLESRRSEEIVARSTDRHFARAVVVLWSEEPRLAQRSMTPPLVDAVTAGPPSRQTVITLAALLLTHYDLLDDWHEGLFAAVTSAVDRAVGGTRHREHQDLVEVIRASGRYVTRVDGPQVLAGELVATGTTPENQPEARALCGNDQGRYARVLRNSYYLAQIHAADHTTDGHAFLADATARATTLRRDEDDRRFGIAVLTALLDKPDGRMPSASWVEAVVEVGGDPRHEQNPTWREWWAHVPDDLRARAVRWMSGADLRTFLAAVELFGIENGNVDLQRMFPQRQRFLMGLYESGLVRSTRLILGEDVRATVRRVTNLGLYDVPRFADPRRDTAIVFVDCGDFHLVEGSHNFKLHVYLGEPEPVLTDPLHRSFTRDDLTKTVPYRHQQRHGESAFGAWSHHGSAWLWHALDFLRDGGVSLDESALVTRQDLAYVVQRRRGTTAPHTPARSRRWWSR
ncbi:EH signature domain-containing protein [Promicromonospora sp. Marseille-Q5078]